MNEDKNRVELIEACAPALAECAPTNWAHEVLLWLEKHEPSCVTNGGTLDTARVVEAIADINPQWLKDLPRYLEPCAARTKVAELLAHIAKVRYDADEYVKLVPHKVHTARIEADVLISDLLGQLKKALRRYFDVHKAVA